MKVGTDGVLLGAWADINDGQSILDIGTGTGLIALMAAQRSPHGTVTGVEIDSESAAQAGENVARSPFSRRIAIVASAFQDFARERGPQSKFDVLLCNPPFFAHALKSPDAARATARHDDTLTLDELARWSAQLLAEDGTLSVVLPFDRRADMVTAAATHGLFVSRETHVSTLRNLPPKRILLTFKQDIHATSVPTTLCIDEEPGVRSAEFARLVKDFYLH